MVLIANGSEWSSCTPTQADVEALGDVTGELLEWQLWGPPEYLLATNEGINWEDVNPCNVSDTLAWQVETNQEVVPKKLTKDNLAGIINQRYSAILLHFKQIRCDINGGFKSKKVTLRCKRNKNPFMIIFGILR